MIYYVVELVELANMAEFGLLRNNNQRLIINEMLGLERQIKWQLRDELVIHVNELIINEHPNGEAVCFTGDEVTAGWAAELDLLFQLHAPYINLSQNGLLPLN